MCFGDLKRIIFNIIAYSPSKIYTVFRRFEDNDDVWTYCLLTVSIIIESLVQYNIRNYFCLHKFWKFSWLVFTSWIYEVSYSYFIDVENFSIFDELLLIAIENTHQILEWKLKYQHMTYLFLKFGFVMIIGYLLNYNYL